MFVGDASFHCEILEGRAAIDWKKGLKKTLWCSAGRNSKCCPCHRLTPINSTGWALTAWQHLYGKLLGGPDGWQAGHEPAVCPGSKEVNSILGRMSRSRGWRMSKGLFPNSSHSLTCTEKLCSILVPVLLGWLGMEHWPAEEKMGNLGIFSLEKRVHPRKTNNRPLVLIGRSSKQRQWFFRVTCGNSMSKSRHMLKQERVRLSGEVFSSRGQLSYGMGFLERLCNLHAWRFLRCNG